MKKVKETLEAMTFIYDKKMSREAIILFLSDLSMYSENQLLESLKRCRSELKFFPSIAEIKDRINDGHPNPNEAWAKIPKSEGESVCWTNEMKQSYAVACSLIFDGDMIGARVAFLESYKIKLSESRANNKPAKYELSLGFDKSGRSDAIIEAAKVKAISQEKAKELLPLEVKEEGIKLLESLNLVKQIEE